MRKSRLVALGLFICTLSALSVTIRLVKHMENFILFAAHVTLPEHTPPRTVVSISSFGRRVFHMAQCLDSIFSQSYAPDRIIVSIPKTYRKGEGSWCDPRGTDCVSDPTHYDESPESIVRWFSNYMASNYTTQTNNHSVFEFPNLTLQFLDLDWGPATKALGALLLEHDPDTVIITLDDDLVYNRETVHWLASHIGHNMALSFGCEMLDHLHNDFQSFTTRELGNLFATTPRVCKGWLIGWTAVAYRVGHFAHDVWTYLDRLPRGCFYNDDIWLSGYIAKRGVLKVYAPMVMNHVKHWRDTELSLSTIEGGRKRYGIPCAEALF